MSDRLPGCNALHRRLDIILVPWSLPSFILSASKFLVETRSSCPHSAHTQMLKIIIQNKDNHYSKSLSKKTRSERGAAKLYFTGSAEFNRSMRQVSLLLNYYYQYYFHCYYYYYYYYQYYYQACARSLSFLIFIHQSCKKDAHVVKKKF